LFFRFHRRQGTRKAPRRKAKLSKNKKSRQKWTKPYSLKYQGEKVFRTKKTIVIEHRKNATVIEKRKKMMVVYRPRISNPPHWNQDLLIEELSETSAVLIQALPQPNPAFLIGKNEKLDPSDFESDQQGRSKSSRDSKVVFNSTDGYFSNNVQAHPDQNGSACQSGFQIKPEFSIQQLDGGGDESSSSSSSNPQSNQSFNFTLQPVNFFWPHNGNVNYYHPATIQAFPNDLQQVRINNFHYTPLVVPFQQPVQQIFNPVLSFQQQKEQVPDVWQPQPQPHQQQHQQHQQHHQQQHHQENQQQQHQQQKQQQYEQYQYLQRLQRLQLHQLQLQHQLQQNHQQHTQKLQLKQNPQQHTQHLQLQQNHQQHTQHPQLQQDSQHHSQHLQLQQNSQHRPHPQKEEVLHLDQASTPATKAVVADEDVIEYEDVRNEEVFGEKHVNIGGLAIALGHGSVLVNN